MQNRTRNKQLNLKFTEEEINYIKKKKELSGADNFTDFILGIAAHSQIFAIDTKPLLLLSNEVNKVGININQIAKIANTTGNIYENDIVDLKERVSVIENLLSEILCEFNSARGL